MTTSQTIMYGSSALSSGREGQWLPVGTSLLPVLAKAGISVYARYSADEFPIMFCAPHLTPTRQQLAVFTELDNAILCIRGDSVPLYRTYLQEYWPDLYDDKSQTTENLLFAAVFLANDYMATEADGCDGRSLILVAETVTSIIVELLEKREISFELLFRSLCHARRRANHLSNVGFYQAFFAKQSHFNSSEILAATIAALVHDSSGQSESTANDEAFEAERATGGSPGIAAREAFRALGRESEFSANQLLMIYQYMERIDGKGGPVGLVDDEISLWSKMFAIVKQFDMLTCGNEASPAKSRTSAMKILLQGANTKYDSQLLDAWNDIVLARRPSAVGAGQ